MYTQDPHSKEAEAEGSLRVQGHPMLLGEFLSQPDHLGRLYL